MSIETDFFLGYMPDSKKLINYGFKRKEGSFIYSQYFMNNDFKAEIKINSHYQVSGIVYDTVTKEPYLELRLKDQKQLYVQEVKDAYLDILKDIKDHAFIESSFLTPQANRVSELIYKTYKDSPCFMWSRAPHCGVFKHPKTDKWYGIIQNIDKTKLGEEESGLVEVLNLKIDEDRILKLLDTKGIYPAWHMNKKYWISVILDETLKDSEILKLVEESFKITQKNIKEWIVPANPNFFDLEAAFKKKTQILWKQSSNIKPQDIVYMYVASPYSAIMYKCQVVKTDIPYDFHSDDISIKKVMKIKLLTRYTDKFMDFKRLKKLGVTAIRGPRSCPQKVCSLLEKYKRGSKIVSVN